MIEDYPREMRKAGLPPPKEKPPVKIEMMHPHQIILSEEVSVDKNDDSRLEEFRQLKREIRGSTRHLVVGMDIAKERHNAFFGTPAGKTLLRRLVFDNTREGFEKLCFQANILKTRHGLAHVVFGMEPTADYHKPLGEYLINTVIGVVLVAGTAVKKNRELLDGRWDKHDTKDAANVADLVTQGKCLFYEFPSLYLRELRSLLSLKRRLKKSEQGYKVRIRNHLIAQYFPEMDAYFSYGEGPAIVRWCLDPAETCRSPFEEFVRMVSSRNGSAQQRRRLEEIHKKAAIFHRLCGPSLAWPSRQHSSLTDLQQLHTHDTGDGQEDRGGMQKVPRVSLSLEHPRLRSRYLCKGSGGHRQSSQIREP